MHPRIGRRSSLRLSARRRTSSKTKSGQRRPITRINSEQLSTEDFDAYVKVVWKKIPISLRYSSLCVDSLYYKAYMERYKREKVISWMVRDGCFTQRYVFVPICQASHWSLLILCNFGKDFNSDTTRPCILLLDSLQAREENIQTDIRKFVFAIYKKWKPETSDQLIHDIPFRMPKVPQQKDGNRCGYYVIFYIYRFLLMCPDEFCIDEDYPSFMREDWFTTSEFDSFCENLASVWEELEYELLQFGLDAEENPTKEDIAENQNLVDKKNELEVINIDSAIKDTEVDNRDSLDEKIELEVIDLSSGRKDLQVENKGDDKNEESVLVAYTPESSQEATNIPQCVTQNKVAAEVKMKKILKIKIKPAEVRRSPRLVTPASKRRRIAVEGQSTRSASRKGKKVDYVEYISSSDAETEPECEAEKIIKSRKRPAKTNKNQKDGLHQSKKRRTTEKKNDKPDKKKRKEKSDKGQNSKQEEKQIPIEMPKKLKLRAHPSNFIKAMEHLSPPQKQWIKEAGFGDLLSFSLRHIPVEMAVNVVWFYDPYHNWLNLDDNIVIRITENDVHDILGLPKGKRNVILAPADAVKNEWRDQYPKKKAGHKITELMILNAITSTGEVNLQFKQNFMVLMYNLFIRCIKNPYVSQDVLGLVGNFDQASEFNWCKLVVEELQQASVAWLQDPKNQYYTGSLMFLIFLYLDRVENEAVKVERKKPAFTGWTNYSVLQRNQVDVVDNTYGKGKIEGNKEVHEDSEADVETYATEVIKDINVANDMIEDECILEHGGDVNIADHTGQTAVHWNSERGSVQVEEILSHDVARVNPTAMNGYQVSKATSVANDLIEETIATSDINNEFAEKNFVDSQQFQTPSETIKGVHSFEMNGINSGIMSIVKDINCAHVDEELIKEEDLMLQIKNEIEEMKRIKKVCHADLRTARALFSTNPDLESLEEDFRKLINHIDVVESVERMPAKVQFPERERREVKLGELHKSPFRERTIDIDKPTLSKAEEDVWKWLNANNDYPLQRIFMWDNNVICTKHEIQTLQVDRQLVSGVLDTYACLLNGEEKFRSLDSPHRFFCNTYNTLGTFTRTTGVNPPTNDDAVKEKQYRIFKENLDHILQKHSVDIQSVDLLFFPIHDISHYYVICFNLKNPAIEILDNNKIGDNFNSIYDGIPERLQQNFVRYMMTISERKAEQLRNVPIIRLEMKWRTESNKFDCGIFAIRHMETYKGNGLRNWDCKFLPENEKATQKRKLKRARQLYAFKIISSHINSLRGTMQKEIDEIAARI